MGLYGAETAVGRRVKNKGNPQVSRLPKKTSIIILRKSIFQKIAVKSAKKCPSAQNLALKSRDNQRSKGEIRAGRNIAGVILAVFTLVIPRRLVPMSMMISEPVTDI